MWPVGADEVLIFREGGPRNTVTLYFETVNGIVSTTLNADMLGTEDMFRSQDPNLCDPGPNDPQEDLVCAEEEGAGPSSRISATGPNDPQEESELLDSQGGPNAVLVSTTRTGPKNYKYEFKYDPQEESELLDSEETPSRELHASMELPNVVVDSDETPDLDFHASMEISSEEDDGPQPTNRMCDHPIPPELQSGSGARNKEVGTPARSSNSDCDYQSNYDHLTPSSDDENENMANIPIRPSDYPGVRPSRLSEYRKKLTPAEIKSQDFIYEDMPPQFLV